MTTKPEYKPTAKTEDGRAEARRLIALALLRGWAVKTQVCEVGSRRPAPGKGQAWGWGK